MFAVPRDNSLAALLHVSPFCQQNEALKMETHCDQQKDKDAAYFCFLTPTWSIAPGWCCDLLRNNAANMIRKNKLRCAGDCSIKALCTLTAALWLINYS